MHLPSLKAISVVQNNSRIIIGPSFCTLLVSSADIFLVMPTTFVAPSLKLPMCALIATCLYFSPPLLVCLLGLWFKGESSGDTQVCSTITLAVVSCQASCLSKYTFGSRCYAAIQSLR